MPSPGRPAKKPRSRDSRTPSGNSEVWDFLDRQTSHSVVVQAAVPDPNPSAPPRAPVQGGQSGASDPMFLEYWEQPKEVQLNIRLPAAAKQMIEKLARRKTVGVSTLVRMWVIESLRREARPL